MMDLVVIYWDYSDGWQFVDYARPHNMDPPDLDYIYLWHCGCQPLTIVTLEAAREDYGLTIPPKPKRLLDCGCMDF